MALLARKVLEDCRAAHSNLELCTSEVDWRLHWIGAVALIRAVGHVLLYEDGRDTRVKTAIDLRFKMHKEQADKHQIYFEFIKKERDNVLKHYRMAFQKGEVWVAVSSDDKEVLFDLGEENLFRPLAGPFGEGEDARDVYMEAISWWEAELAEIEKEIRN